jgi:hypothetical protein
MHANNETLICMYGQHVLTPIDCMEARFDNGYN